LEIADLEVADLSDKIMRAVKGISGPRFAANWPVTIARYGAVRPKTNGRPARRGTKLGLEDRLANIGLPPMLHCAKARPLLTLEPVQVRLNEAAIVRVWPMRVGSGGPGIGLRQRG
jgi:hypothetical protein